MSTMTLEQVRDEIRETEKRIGGLHGSGAFKIWADAIDALLREREAGKARVTDGYQLVPIEPTREMLEKSVRASMEAESVYDEPRPDGAWEKFGRRINRISHVYKAMLAAAPNQDKA